MQVQSRLLICSLPLDMCDEEFEVLLRGYTRQYHLDLLPQRMEEHRFSVEILGRQNHVDAFTVALTRDLTGWGGRVFVEHTVPVGKPLLGARKYSHT